LGVDISDEAVKLAHRVAPESRVAVATGEALCFRDRSFDYVTCLGSLEHFLDMGQGLREMQRVAKPDALLCVMVPNSDFVGCASGAAWHRANRTSTSSSCRSTRGAACSRTGLEIVRIGRTAGTRRNGGNGQARGVLQ